MLKKFVSRTYLILFAIFLLSLFLRFYQLGSVPFGFHIDEASLGYNAYSLLQTGRDENNHLFPLYIDMFGDNRPSGYHIIDIVPVMLFGLNVFATRFPAALFGSLLVFPLYFLAFSIFKDKRIGLLVAFLGAMSPWSIVVSRASGEAIIALFFITLGFALLLHSISKEKVSYLLSGTLCIILSFFFYHTPRVFVPMLFFSLFLSLFSLWRKTARNYKVVLLTCFIITSLVSFALVFLVTGGTGRFTQVNIFGFPETRLVMNEQLQEDGVMKSMVTVSRMFHNKVISYFLTFSRNYFEYFTGGFLFISGGLPAWYRVPGMGLLYLIELPFILWGIVAVATSRKIIEKTPLIWLLVAPITAAITVDDIPNINRTLVMLPALEMLAACGVVAVFGRIIPRFRLFGIFILSLVFLYSVLYFFHQYSVNAPIHKNWYRNVGFEEMGEIVESNYGAYDKIVVTKALGGIYPLLLFSLQYDPRAYQSEGSVKDAGYAGFGKLFFVPQACPATQQDSRFPTNKKILYIEKGECMGGNKSEYIDRLDGTHVFHIVYE